MSLIHFMLNSPVAEHPNQYAIVEKRLMSALITAACCSRDKILEILFNWRNFRFVFLHTVLRCSVKSNLLSIMAPKIFSETLFLIAIFSH